LRAGDGEQVGEAGDRDAEIGARTVRPLLLQRAAGAALEVQGLERAGQGVEAGGEDDDVESVLLPASVISSMAPSVLASTSSTSSLLNVS